MTITWNRIFQEGEVVLTKVIEDGRVHVLGDKEVARQQIKEIGRVLETKAEFILWMRAWRPSQSKLCNALPHWVLTADCD